MSERGFPAKTLDDRLPVVTESGATQQPSNTYAGAWFEIRLRPSGSGSSGQWVCRGPCDVMQQSDKAYQRVKFTPNHPMPEILVVDDDELIRELIAEWLAAAGYRTRAADNGATALRLLHEHRSDLIITDLHMPILGGEAVIARLRDACPEVPVIAISGHFRSGRQFTPERVLAQGAQRALPKPLSRLDLLGAVREILGASCP